jgi:hypothetical protein
VATQGSPRATAACDFKFKFLQASADSAGGPSPARAIAGPGPPRRVLSLSLKLNRGGPGSAEPRRVAARGSASRLGDPAATWALPGP